MTLLKAPLSIKLTIYFLIAAICFVILNHEHPEARNISTLLALAWPLSILISIGFAFLLLFAKLFSLLGFF